MSRKTLATNFTNYTKLKVPKGQGAEINSLCSPAPLPLCPSAPLPLASEVPMLTVALKARANCATICALAVSES